LVAEPPLLSARGQELASAPAPDRRRPGPPRAFRLGTPALDLFPLRSWSRIARQCVRSATPRRLDYSALAGLLSLREAIAEQVRSRGTRCTAEQVIVVAGAQRGLDLALHLLIDPGDAVAMEEPGYPGAQAALLAAGGRRLSVPVDADGLEVARLHEGQGVRVACVTPSHQFPLGVPLSLPRRQSLLAWARRSHAWVIEDDYDCDFRYQAQPLPCLHALDPDGRVIYLGSFSKTLFPALRLGYLIVPHQLVGGFLRARLASDLHPPALEQSMVARFLADGHYQRHLRRMQAAYSERLEALRQAMARSGAPLSLRPVHSGLHAVADLEGVAAERVSATAAERQLEVVPLSHYYRGDGPRQNALLLGFAAVGPRPLRAAVEKLAQAIAASR
jgi:GntR family transcriptional regulator/MocR family aminotransferase